MKFLCIAHEIVKLTLLAFLMAFLLHGGFTNDSALFLSSFIGLILYIIKFEVNE